MSDDDLKKRIALLRRELAAAESQLARQTPEMRSGQNLQLSDLFDLDELQAIQDAFAKATGVASIITAPNGEAITKPSNFCSLCNDIIRKTEKGLCNCMKSDAILGRYSSRGPTIQPCLSGGLWDGGASISVDGHHIANWLVGQVRNEYIDEDRMMAYAREIGADETEFARAFNKVTVMPLDQFKQVGEALFLLANLMSWTAYQNYVLNDNLAEIRASHEEIGRLKSFLSNIIDSMPSTLVGVDPEGRVTHWNMRAADETGLSHGQAKGRLLVELLPSLSGEVDKLLSVISDRQPMVAKRISEEVDGELRHNDISAYPLIANGVQGAVIRVDDITERVRIEEMMIQSEKMLSVGGLAAGMAHEVNNPLAAILGNAHLLKKRLFGDGKKNRKVAEAHGLDFEALKAYMGEREIDTMIRAIADSGKRAGKVVTNMLGFSRKGDGSTQDEDPRVVLDDAVELVKNGHDLKNSYSFKEIEFVREYPEHVLHVNCEASKLQQVFFNILNNGAQAMTATYKDVRRMPKFVLRCSSMGDCVRIEITDNGPGMSDEVRERVFEPFYTTKAPGIGTGLGMSVSYFIVTEVLGGSLHVASRPDQGATFTIDLPAVRA